ncbi:MULTISPECIES: hypothetical protein [unclassified Rhizobium]|nr:MULTISPECIES: hypothetical protein [unclassified Rhizobium]MBP2463890.1 hypothetical protein [Rhizobium sp. PvP014]MBP2532117.1 hypothetical protein [Rhizobium sp. PvP099]
MGGIDRRRMQHIVRRILPPYIMAQQLVFVAMTPMSWLIITTVD